MLDTPHSLRIAQLNCAQSPDMVLTTLSLHGPRASCSHFLCIQEPAWSAVSSGTMVAPSHLAWTTFLPLSPMPVNFHLCALIYVNKSIDSSYIRACPDLIKFPDICVMDIHIPRQRPFCIVNVYIHPDLLQKLTSEKLSDFLTPLVDLVQDAIPTLFLGDFNCHHPEWSPAHCPVSSHASTLHDWYLDNALTLLAPKAVPTSFRDDYSSMLDLIFSSAEAHLFLRPTLSIDDVPTTATDHTTLLIDITLTQETKGSSLTESRLKKS